MSAEYLLQVFRAKSIKANFNRARKNFPTIFSSLYAYADTPLLNPVAHHQGAKRPACMHANGIFHLRNCSMSMTGQQQSGGESDWRRARARANGVEERLERTGLRRGRGPRRGRLNLLTCETCVYSIQAMLQPLLHRPLKEVLGDCHIPRKVHMTERGDSAQDLLASNIRDTYSRTREEKIQALKNSIPGCWVSTCS